MLDDQFDYFVNDPSMTSIPLIRQRITDSDWPPINLYFYGSTTNLMETTITNVYNRLIFKDLHVNVYNININGLIYWFIES